MQNVYSAYFVRVDEKYRIEKGYKLKEVIKSWPINEGIKLRVNDQ